MHRTAAPRVHITVDTLQPQDYAAWLRLAQALIEHVARALLADPARQQPRPAPV